jgi:hypothetical protein
MADRSSAAISSAFAATGGPKFSTSRRIGTAPRCSGPYNSHTKRLSARIAMGRSFATNAPSSSTRGTFPRRHAVSHGAPQTRPQMDAKGFGPRAMR